MRKHYPVTAAEIGHARTRTDTYGCHVAVREEYTFTDGRTIPMLSYGHDTCYHYVQHNGYTYGVPRDGINVEFCTR